MPNPIRTIRLILTTLCALLPTLGAAQPPDLHWTSEQTEVWQITGLGEADSDDFMVRSLGAGEQGTGTLRSSPFTVSADTQTFEIAGADGTTTTTNGGHAVFLRMRSWPDGEILRETRPPGTHLWQSAEWQSFHLIGREVFLELVDNNPGLHPKGFAWIGLRNYRQKDSIIMQYPVAVEDLFGLKIDTGAQLERCRSLPFLAAAPERRGESVREIDAVLESVPVHATARCLYVSGLFNHGWDYGLAHWGEHPELLPIDERQDLISIGSEIGRLEILYADGTQDEIPLVIGITAWHLQGWCHAPSHHYTQAVMEPLASRPEYMHRFRQTLRLGEHPEFRGDAGAACHYYLAIEPRDREIATIRVRDNERLRGRPLLGAVTLRGARPAAHLHPFGKWKADRPDLEPRIQSSKPARWDRDIEGLKKLLYTCREDLPQRVEILDFPDDFKATRIRFDTGSPTGDMLSNIWTANLMQIDEKYDADGFFHESGKDYPFYGGYMGIGTWAPVGVYHNSAFPRCSDHFLSLALRLIKNPERDRNYVDLVDRWLYFYRPNHDPAQGPPNEALDIERYPDDMPPHWAFVLNSPLAMPVEINELAGAEETDGHAATMVGRWMVWRIQGMPTGDWLLSPREQVYGKSRWQSTVDAAEFLCWMMDYTGRDVMWCEGETSGWGGNGKLHPPDMREEKDPRRIRENYANADMFEPYPTYLSLTALRCSAEMAEALGHKDQATRWRAYADRLQAGMVRLLAIGPEGHRTWKQSRFSVLPSLQDSLVQAWFSIYRDGLDPKRLDPEMTRISRNTLRRQLGYPYGHKPVLAMGYGMGWLTKAAMILDDMDASGKLLENIAVYSYDKNMNYRDPERGIDWTRFQWMIPEGTKLMPDGYWYRIGDLTNGANQGPAMHALELCAGVDDTHPDTPRLLPRVPPPLQAIEVKRFPMLIRDGAGIRRVILDFRYEREGAQLQLEADAPIPRLDIRFGPFSQAAAEAWAAATPLPEGANTRLDQSGNYLDQPAWWVWVENLRETRRLNLGG